MNLDWASRYSRTTLQLVLGLTIVVISGVTIASSQTRKLSAAQPTHGPAQPHDTETTINLRDFGALGDGETDDGPALQSALDVLAQTGGGTLYVPAGEYAIVSPVGKQFSSSDSIIIQGEPSNIPINVGPNGLGLGLTSEFVIKVGETNDAISISGAEGVRFSDISFIGVQEVINDAHIVLKLTDISDAKIQHCEFYGLASLVTRGALVFAFHSNLTIQETPFLGCATSSGLSTSVVQNVRWQGISLIDSKFIDYGQRPGFFSKTPLSPSYSWLGINNAAALEPADSRREAIVQNVFMDEGQFFGIAAIPELFDNVPSAPFEVYLSRITMNVSNLASVGVYLDDAQKVLIDRSYFGWSHNAGAAIALTNVGEAVFDQVECAVHANTIVADAATQRLIIINSIYTNLISEAPDTQTIITNNPMDDPVQYVRQQYLNVVGHEPDPVGQYYWADLMLRCDNDSACLTQKRSALAAYLGTSPSSKFSIDGTVQTEDGIPLAGAVVELSGSQSVSTISDASGQYSFQDVATAGTYLITATKRHYTFETLAFETPGDDQTGDFTGVLDRHTISGRVATSTGQPIAGAVVELSDEDEQTATTDANGNYSFPDLGAGNDYTVTVSRHNYSFADPSTDFFDLSADGVANFTGALLNYDLRGRVVSGTGSAIVGATVTLRGARQGSQLSDATGMYSFQVPAEANYTISVSRANYSFASPSHSFTNLSGNATANFTGNLLHYTLSGHAMNNQGAALAGVVITLTGSATGSTTTNSAGAYSFSVTAEGNYSLAATLIHYDFNPVIRSFTNLSSNATGDFIASLTTYTLSGRITNNRSVPLPGVAVNLSGAHVATTSTDSQGRYSFAVTALGNYVVTPVLKHYRSYPQKAQHDSLASSLLDNFAFFPVDTMHVDGGDGGETSTVNPNGMSGSESIDASNRKGSGGSVSSGFSAFTLVAPINPIDDPRTFVSQQYSDLLGRMADTEGLDYWTSEITRCGDDADCKASMRVAVATEFLTGQELQQTGGFVYRLYRAALGTPPTFNQFMDQRRRLNPGDFEPRKTAIVRNFVVSPEFLAQYPGTLTTAQFIERLVSAATQNTGVDLASTRQSLLAEYRRNHDRSRVVQLIADNELVQKAENNGGFVLMQYFGYLQRDPDEAGYAFWLNVLNHQQPGNFRGMVCAFITAREYQERFSQVISRDDRECRSLH